MSKTTKTHVVNRYQVAAILFLSLILSLATGCSTYSSMERKAKRMVRDLRAPDSDLKKRIGITLFENKTAFVDTDMQQRFLIDLTEKIMSSCPSGLLEKPGDSDYPDFLIKLPRKASGQIDNYDLAESGRRSGLNSIVTGALNDARIDKRKKGFWWWKDIHHYVQFQIVAEVYDTETGAKLLDESFMREIEIDESDLESTGADTEIKAYIKDDIFKTIAIDMGEKICNAVVLDPWTGYIASIADDKIILSSGERVGIQPGDIFEVYNSTDTFEGVDGHRFFIPGLKTGEIKITAVYPNTAEAIRISGQDIRAGFTVRPKD